VSIFEYGLFPGTDAALMIKIGLRSVRTFFFNFLGSSGQAWLKKRQGDHETSANKWIFMTNFDSRNSLDHK